MQNVSPARRLSRRSRDMLFAAAFVFLMGAGMVVLGIALHVFNLVVPFNPGAAAYDLTRKAILSLGAGIILVSFVMALRAISWKTNNMLAREVGAQLAAHLDRHHVFIRNISKRSLGYIDAVLVNKHGVLVFRLSKRKGRFFNEKGKWLLGTRKGNWRSIRWNPTREAANDLKRMRAYLQKHQMMDVPIFAVIVFTREAPLVQLTVREPALPVVHASQLVSRLRDSYFAQNRMNAETVQRVVNLLYR